MEWLAYTVFGAVCLLILAFSLGFVFIYKLRGEPSIVTTIIGTFSLVFTLFSLFLIPVDVYMTTHGDFNSSKRVDMKWTYYGFDIIFMLCVFFFLPFAYFYYEELGDLEDTENTFKQRACAALKYTLIFTIIFVVLIVLGAFISFSNGKTDNNESNDWKSNVADKYKSNTSRILPFCLAVLMSVGLFFAMIYTAYGLGALPITLMRAIQLQPRVNESERDMEMDDLNRELEELKLKYRGRSESEWEKRDKLRLKNLERKRSTLKRTGSSSSSSSRGGSRFGQKARERRREKERQRRKKARGPNDCLRCLAGIWNLAAPLRILIGISLLCLSTLIVVSMMVHLLDQGVNSHCGYSCGFNLDSRSWLNPTGYVLSYAAKVFPIDYILFSGIVFWLFTCTVAGLNMLDVRFLCFKLFSLRPGSTMHNALMMAIGFIILIVASFQFLMLTLANDYVTWGHRAATKNCNLNKGSKHYCEPTEIYYILSGITIGYPIFGLVYYIFSWIFCLVFIGGLLVSLFKNPGGDKRGELLKDDDDDLEAIFKD